jgi:hypothetical protein
VWRLAAGESRRTDGAAPPSVFNRSTFSASALIAPVVGEECDQRGRQAGGVSARGNVAASESRPTESAAPPFGPYAAPAH